MAKNAKKKVSKKASKNVSKKVTKKAKPKGAKKKVSKNPKKAKTKKSAAAKSNVVAIGKSKAKHSQAKQTNANHKGSSVLWKFLEIKEAKRREHAEQVANGLKEKTHGALGNSKENGRHEGFSRFSGPRRRAA